MDLRFICNFAVNFHDMKIYGNFFCAAALLCALVSGCAGLNLTREEKNIIGAADSRGVMRVLTIGDRTDSLELRRPCLDFSKSDLEKMFTDESSPAARLAEQMVATVTDPSQDGVGIAGPQVGLSRRIVAVQRFDKEGAPFEVFPNIRIVEYGRGRRTGAEGCLSIPGRRGMVERADTVVIEYARKAAMDDSVQPFSYVRETVGGFTAVIFQHECDHLDGVLYIDRLAPQSEI